MKAKRQDYEIRSTERGRITGTMMLSKSTRGEANKYARHHSRDWKSRSVHVLAGNFPLATFENGKEVQLRTGFVEVVSK